MNATEKANLPFHGTSRSQIPTSYTIKTLLRSILLWGVMASMVAADNVAPAVVKVSDVPWSLRRLPETEPLLSSLDFRSSDSAAQPIDRSIRLRLKKLALTPAPRAALYLQVRRLSLMLTGLPPDPATVREFMANPTDEKYAVLVDRYLASAQYGERWARHWMDVVRYAETWGYEWNHLVREAWRYRDYLIRAFNQDLPYDQFIREHIAGDLLDPPRANETLGINESLIGGAFYRFGETGHDDCVLYPEISLDVMDNQIDTLSKAFQAQTVACSRCHNHKIDDIPQTDYYGLLGVMASSRQVIRTLDLPHRQDELKRKLVASKQKIRRDLANVWARKIEEISAASLVQLIRSPEQSVGKEKRTLDDPGNMEHPLFVWRKMTNLPEGKSWQQHWNETRQSMQEEHERRGKFNRENFVPFGDFTNRSKGRASDHPNWSFEGLAVENGECFTFPGDFSVRPDGSNVISSVLPAGLFSHGLSQKLNAAVRSPLLPEDKKFISYQAMGERSSVCRTVIANCTLPYFHTHRFNSSNLTWITVDLAHIRTSPLVRLKSYLEWATALDDQGFPVLNMPQAEYQKSLDNPRSWFGVTRAVMHDVKEPPLQELQAPLQVFDSPVADPDALAQRYRAILQTAISRWSEGRASESDVFWINSFMNFELLSRGQDASAPLTQSVVEYRALEEQIETPQRIVGIADQDEGFDVPLFGGGDPKNPRDLAHRGYLSAIEPLISDKPMLTGSGRRRTAELIAHPQNPLTARVMANRIWHYLFGSGIVRTVDDFGNLGDRPSHPELLDYLARRLIDSGWSIKAVVREIVLSDTFRQSSASSVAGEQKDPENRFFHRYASRRLEAEVIRDSMLLVSGRLDSAMFGPSINPYRQEEVDRRKLYVGPLDGAGRRSIYLSITRMGPPKLLQLFNLPDPSVTRGRRDSTNVPAQALGLLNDPFVNQQARVNARRILNETGADIAFGTRLERLFLSLFSRPPDEMERREYVDFFEQLATAHGFASGAEALEREDVWKDLIHTLYNLKEFTYVL